MLGGSVDDKTDQEIIDEESKTKEMLKHPLAGFPDDIRYFTKKQCRDKITITKRFKGRIAKESRWDEYRMEACLGEHSLVAKRCSMNDVLWGRLMAHSGLLLEDIKKMVMFDIKRKELYPPGYKGVGREPPPVEYLKQLKSEGKLDEINKELNEIMRK